MVAQVHPEVNDRDISPLFHWYDKFTISDLAGKEFDVWIRLVGDAELYTSKVFATRKSIELRKRLKDLDSDERVALIPSKEDFRTKEEIIDWIILYNYKSYVKKAYDNVSVKKPKEPSSDATIEDLEKYQEQLDSWEDKRKAKIKDYADKLIELEKNDLMSKSIEEVYDTFVSSTINKLCEDTLFDHLIGMCTFLGTYKDDKMTQRFFEDYFEFYNLRKEIKNQFIAGYNSLEISSDDLKN